MPRNTRKVARVHIAEKLEQITRALGEIRSMVDSHCGEQTLRTARAAGAAAADQVLQGLTPQAVVATPIAPPTVAEPVLAQAPLAPLPTQAVVGQDGKPRRSGPTVWNEYLKRYIQEQEAKGRKITRLQAMAEAGNNYRKNNPAAAPPRRSTKKMRNLAAAVAPAAPAAAAVAAVPFPEPPTAITRTPGRVSPLRPLAEENSPVINNVEQPDAQADLPTPQPAPPTPQPNSQPTAQPNSQPNSQPSSKTLLQTLRDALSTPRNSSQNSYVPTPPSPAPASAAPASAPRSRSRNRNSNNLRTNNASPVSIPEPSSSPAASRAVNAASAAAPSPTNMRPSPATYAYEDLGIDENTSARRIRVNDEDYFMTDDDRAMWRRTDGDFGEWVGYLEPGGQIRQTNGPNA